MNIVFVKHGTSREFAFRVPDEMATYIKKDQGVLCDTIRGLDYGTTTTGVINGDGALDIAIKNGAYLPLKSIIGIEHPAFANSAEIRRIVTDEVVQKISAAFRVKA